MAHAKKTQQEIPEQPFHSGDRIRKARELTGMDRQTFAETIGIHRDTLAKYEETGKAKRSTLIIVAWATPARLEWLECGELPWLNVGPTGIEPMTSTVQTGRLATVTPIFGGAA
jgi:DNA-binding XRE family transcriptional regulator